jgi:hypothetical protein
VFTGNASSHQWYKDGAAIAGATGMTYVVEDAGWQDQGDYYCVASDGANAATSDWATLDVVPEPTAAVAAVFALLWAVRRSDR